MTTIADLQSQIDAITNELGVHPQGIYSNVRIRLDILESRIGTGGGGGGGGNFTAGGDLSGSPTFQVVIGIQGIPVSINVPDDGSVLGYVAIDNQWEPLTLNGDVQGTIPSNYIASISGLPVSLTNQTDGFVVTYVDENGDLELQPIPTQNILPTVVVTSGPYNVLSTDYILLCKFINETHSINLPIPIIGRIITVKDSAGTASVGNPITVNHHASELIDGVATFSLTNTYETVTFVSDGTNWSIL